MNIECLLPITPGLVLNGIYYGEKQLTLSLSSSHPVAYCPICQSSSQRIHSRYGRKVADLPWADKRVLLKLSVRRFFCDRPECKRKVFAERLHPSIAAYARRTTRMEEYLQTLALQLGGEKAALLLKLLNISLISADTLLNLSRKILPTTVASPKVVGIDVVDLTLCVIDPQGYPQTNLCYHIGRFRNTYTHRMRLEKVPKRRPTAYAGYKYSLSEEQHLYLAKRWQAGDAKPRQIWRELKTQGYRGTASCIYRAIAHLPIRANKEKSTAKSELTDEKVITRAQPVFSARRAMWLMVKPKEDLSEKKQEILSILLANHSQAKVVYPLAQRFITMVKNRQCQHLDGWIIAAKKTGIARLKQFVAGIERDYQAVQAGLSMEWSNGQVEGQITRLKLIKRQGYGRAKLDLLKKRVLYKPTKQAA